MIRPPETCLPGHANCLLCDYSVEYTQPFNAEATARELTDHDCEKLYDAPKPALVICDNN